MLEMCLQLLWIPPCPDGVQLPSSLNALFLHLLSASLDSLLGEAGDGNIYLFAGFGELRHDIPWS